MNVNRISRRRWVKTATGTVFAFAAATPAIVEAGLLLLRKRNDERLAAAKRRPPPRTKDAATRFEYSSRNSRRQGFNLLDDFDSFNVDLWAKGDHKLGRGYLYASNVSIEDGDLMLKLPANRYDGAEVASKKHYKHGGYTARIKCPEASGSISAFFLYRGAPSGNDEIDIEIHNDGTAHIDLTTWVKGEQTNETQHTLPFDPSGTYHEYRISYHEGWVSFYVDGHLLQTWTRGLPTSDMLIVSNAWWPSWLSGPKPPTDRYTRIDWIKYSASKR